MTPDEEKEIVDASMWEPNLTDVPVVAPPALSRESSAAGNGVGKDGHSFDAGKHGGGAGPFMGLERRKSASFTDPDAGNYSFSIFGGTSFRADGSLIPKRGKRDVGAGEAFENPTKKRARTSGEIGRYDGVDDATGPDEWLRKACRLIEDLSNHRLGGDSSTHVETSAPFFVPVAQIKDEVHGYTDIIADPIDFCQIKANLGMGSTLDAMGRKKYDVHATKKYHSFAEFLADVRRVFANCLEFNQSQEAFEIRTMCRALQHYFEAVVKAIES